MSYKNILMVAAENGALPGAKVGGVGDVLKELPPILQGLGCEVSTVIPSYGFLARLPGVEKKGQVYLSFGGNDKVVDVLVWRQRKNDPLSYILHHKDFAPKGETVYCHDDGDRPFATDATKFAFFCHAIAQALIEGMIDRPEVLHCHDWHSAFLLMLLRLNPRFANLCSLRTVYSIHNLAMQGVRPFRDDRSAFASWFPGLVGDVRDIADRRAPNCVNPMLAGIVYADYVHTVSPSYAEEILHPSNYEQGIYGGEGLEKDLCARAEQGRLVGILNGCRYGRKKERVEFQKKVFVEQCLSELVRWASTEQSLRTSHWLAEKRLLQWKAKRNSSIMLSSVGRVTDQKVRLFLTPLKDGELALDAMLKRVAGKGVFVMLGSGDAEMEMELVKISARHDNFIFLNGYSESIANTLYEYGDLFLMPSSFEPCGISQLLAMRAGQPCLVNAVGGLKDTVVADRTGFMFSGSDIDEQAKAMISTFDEALRVYTSSEDIWQAIQKSASKQRFTWNSVAKQYMEKLYSY